jgi:small subunit ribosomal protein S29
MAPTVCLRGFSQLTLDRTASTSIASRCLVAAPRTFSTSSPLLKNPNQKKGNGMVAAPKRGVKSLNVKKGRKGVQADTGKRPNPGERKALRKRIVLSNNNALEVSSLVDLERQSVLSKKNQGQVKGLPEEVVDSLRAVDAFKPTQGWSLFRRPATLIRKETVELAALIQEAEGGPKKTEKVEEADGGAEGTAVKAAEVAKKTIRRVIVGEKMSGKSSLLLQGLAMAFVRKWVVVNLPDGMPSHPFLIVAYQSLTGPKPKI